MLSSRIGLAPLPRFWRASRRSSSRSRPCALATRQAALSVSRCEARTSETCSPNASLTALMTAGRPRSEAGFCSAAWSSSGTSAEIDVALAQRPQRLAVEVLRHHRPEGVDRIGQQQDLDAARPRRLELGIGFQPLDALAHEIVDLGLVGLEVGDILLERAQATFARRRGEARERQELAAALVILVQALLQHRAEGVPDLGVGLGVLVRRALELADARA